MHLVIGEKYRIKKNFNEMRFDDDPQDPGIDDDMLTYAGQTVTVTRNSSREHWYKVEENEWTWDARWLEEIEPETEYKEVSFNDLIEIFK